MRPSHLVNRVLFCQYSFNLQFIFFFKTAVLQKSSDVRLSYGHCNFSRGCLPVKMASKTVIRCIEKGYQTEEVFDRGFSSIHKPVNYLHCPACSFPVDQWSFDIFILTVYVEVSQCKDNKTESLQLLSSAKLVLKQLITRAKVSQ